MTIPIEFNPKPSAKRRRRSFPAAERAAFPDRVCSSNAGRARRIGAAGWLYASIISKWRTRDSRKNSLKKPERGRTAQAAETRENIKLRKEVKRFTEHDSS